MYISKSDRLFHSLTLDEADQMYQVASDIVLKGKLPDPQPAWMAEWLKMFPAPDGMGLLYVSTVFPQFLALSAAGAYNKALWESC